VNPDGNERLTAAIGVLLLVPILVELATIVLGVHTFMSLHVFVGLALIPAVLLKLGSTAWRFARYYTRSRAYVEHGPPQLAMRLLAPLLVAATVVLFGSGVAMGSYTDKHCNLPAGCTVPPPSSGCCSSAFMSSSTSDAPCATTAEICARAQDPQSPEPAGAATCSRQRWASDCSPEPPPFPPSIAGSTCTGTMTTATTPPSSPHADARSSCPTRGGRGARRRGRRRRSAPT